MFMGKGFSFNEALDRAYQVLDGKIMLQSTVLTYMDVFLYLGILFLICVPFVLMLKKGAGKAKPVSSH